MAVTVEHWFDFVCPFCYIAQDRNRVLRTHGLAVAEHGLRIHQEIGPGGAPAGPRVGPTYDFLAHEAEAAGLPLNWSPRMPNTGPALAAYSWLQEHHPEAADPFAAAVFHAYFADRRDIESADLLDELAPVDLRAALATAEPAEALARSEKLAREHGVTGTPTWITPDGGFSGLRPHAWFEQWATRLAG